MTTDVKELKAKFAEEKKQLLARQKTEKAKFSKAASKQLNRKKDYFRFCNVEAN